MTTTGQDGAGASRPAMWQIVDYARPSHSVTTDYANLIVILARESVPAADHVKSRRKAALDYIDAHLGNAQLGPDEIADAAALSRASLYRLLATEGGIRAVLLQRRLDQALRLLLADNNDEGALMDIVKRYGFGGTSQFSRSFRARFGMPPRQYRAPVRQQDLDWHQARLRADGFDQNSLFWRHPGSSGSKPSKGLD